MPAVRSEMIFEKNSIGGATAGIPGALSNQPPTDANIPEVVNGSNAGSPIPGNSSKESTRNFELDTTISHTKQQTGVIRRLSVSVAVDYLASLDALGEAVLTPLAQQELLNIRRLLQGGIGFDVTR
jgi:flagellar M-ring protein FliF